jgi:flagellar hook protein FlgE
MSFQQGLSGLNSSAKNLDAIGNNVANAATVGFKQSQTQFADAYAASLSGGGSLQTGSGSRVAAIAQQFSQGTISTSNNPLDVAISGAGFFGLTDPSGAIYYSRNGQFHEDKDGYIVNSLGHNVTGYEAAQGVVAQVQPPVKLQISAIDKSNPPKVTSDATVGVNLASTALGVDNTLNPFDPGTASTYYKSTALAVYDSAGASHVASLYFQRQPIAATTAVGSVAAGSTSATLTTAAGISIGNTITIAGAGAQTAASTIPLAVPIGATTATVTSSAGMAVGDGITIVGAGNVGTITAIVGNLVTFAPATTALTLAGAAVTTAGSFTPTITGIVGNVVTFSPSTTTTSASGPVVTSNAGSLTWNVFLTVDGTSVPAVAPATALTTLTFGNSGSLLAPAAGVLSANMPWVGGAPVNFDLTQCTQYAGTFNVNGLTQDGYAAGTLSGYSTSADGTILGRYTNGQTQALGQMLLTNFSNPGGLQPVGNNEWVDTVAAGNLGPLTPGTSGRGVLQSSAVEDSNVDLTAELVAMIVAQRMYQANAQTIKAQDQILQTVVNLK